MERSLLSNVWLLLHLHNTFILSSISRPEFLGFRWILSRGNESSLMDICVSFRTHMNTRLFLRFIAFIFYQVLSHLLLSETGPLHMPKKLQTSRPTPISSVCARELHSPRMHGFFKSFMAFLFPRIHFESPYGLLVSRLVQIGKQFQNGRGIGPPSLLATRSPPTRAVFLLKWASSSFCCKVLGLMSCPQNVHRPGRWRKKIP